MHRHLVWTIRTVAFLFAGAVAPHVQAANGVVGPGNCNYAGFSAVLATVDGSGGGTITFNCGTATITFAGYKQVSNAVVIDGGGTITFDGGGNSGFFQSSFGSTLVLKRLTLQHSVYTGGVRALENFGTLVLDHAKVINNTSLLGPVLSSGTARVRWSTFSGNTASSVTDGNGGAIENSFGNLDVEASTFNGNAAAHCGGAIYSTSSTRVTNSTFTANSVTSAGCGGAAMYQAGNGDSAILYSTIAANTAITFGGGIYNEGGANATLTVSNSIIANNTNGNCDGVLVSGGHNVWFGATSCPFSGNGDAAGNPMLGALGNNGGPTQTMLPAGASAAINIIPNSQRRIPFDQRGGSRPSGGGCDAGAVEVNAAIDLIFYDDFD
jgi:hypothetical protein